jgi:hypothetical protein
MKIKTPVPDFCGIVANVRFMDGVGHTDDPYLIKWFKERGYIVDDNGTPTKPIVETPVAEVVEPEVEERPFPYPQTIEDMSVTELREFMKQNGVNPMNIQNKEKLIERFKKMRG